MGGQRYNVIVTSGDTNQKQKHDSCFCEESFIDGSLPGKFMEF